jgi:hypothetical protein
MRTPNRLATLLLAAGSVAGTAVLRRRRRQHRPRVDLYFEDGSMLSLDEGTPEAGAMVPTALDILAVT